MDYCIIEINARLSRSSALASKATGYPLAVRYGRAHCRTVGNRILFVAFAGGSCEAIAGYHAPRDHQRRYAANHGVL